MGAPTVKQTCQNIVHRMWNGGKITARTLRSIKGLTGTQRKQFAQLLTSDRYVSKSEVHWINRKHGHNPNVKFVAGLFQAYTKLPRKATNWLHGSQRVIQGYRLTQVHADVARYAKRGVKISSVVEDLIYPVPKRASKKITVNLAEFLLSMNSALVKDKKRIVRAVLRSFMACRTKYSAGERSRLRLIVQKFDLGSTPTFDRIARSP